MKAAAVPTTTSSSSSAAAGALLERVVQSQLSSLDDADPYATAWKDALRHSSRNNGHSKVSWGGRGQGGRGRARRTYQPRDVVVDNVSLVYPAPPSTTTGSSSRRQQQRVLLEDATLKLLLPGHVYAIIGANGIGKSSLLRRIHAGSIPGFPPHVKTLYISQEEEHHHHDTDFSCCERNEEDGSTATSTSTTCTITVLDALLQQCREFHAQSTQVAQRAIQNLERRMDDLDLTTTTEPYSNHALMEQMMEQVAALEDELEVLNEDYSSNISSELLRQQAVHAINFVMTNLGGHEENEDDDASGKDWSSIKMSSLSAGLRKKVMLATVLLCPCDLLLLDQPTNALDFSGLLQLRRILTMLTEKNDTDEVETLKRTTVLLVSHDIDLINEVATDVFEIRNHKLVEYPKCNYELFLKAKSEHERHLLRQGAALQKKQTALQETLQHLKTQPVSRRRGAAKKKARQLGAHRKKMERVAGDQKEHEAELQAANLHSSEAGGRIGKAKQEKSESASITSTKPTSSPSSSLLPSERAIQFVFRDPTSQWGEPLIVAYDLGHSFNEDNVPFHQEKADQRHHHSPIDEEGHIVKKDGYLFDYVDLRVDEGGTYCILGGNGSGKSVLLQILGKILDAQEGKVKYALNVEVAYMDQKVVDSLIQVGLDGIGTLDALSYLSQQFPTKTEQEVRGELTNFGISPLQATTSLSLISGGERSRVCFAHLMLRDPHVLLLDNPTSNLDPESVDALIFGLRRWKGTLVIVSHDAHFVRSLEATCFVLMAKEGKLRRVERGVDEYLQSFASV